MKKRFLLNCCSCIFSNYAQPTLAFPIGAVCLIINIAFGLMNRVAPQINAYFMAMPAQALGGIVISFATLSITIKEFGVFSSKMIQALLDGIQLLK